MKYWEYNSDTDVYSIKPEYNNQTQFAKELVRDLIKIHNIDGIKEIATFLDAELWQLGPDKPAALAEIVKELNAHQWT